MPKRQEQSLYGLSQAVRKFLLSGFVVFTFIAYAIHERFSHPDSPPAANTSTVVIQSSIRSTPPVLAQSPIQPTSTVPKSAVTSDLPTQPVVPTLPPATATPLLTGRYKDGTYNGPMVNVYYGLVSVQATVQNGQIVDVQFLRFPNDRRTSVRINNIAMPYLQQEAIKAQTSEVNLISGATLTSEGFVVSLREALKPAVN